MKKVLNKECWMSIFRFPGPILSNQVAIWMNVTCDDMLANYHLILYTHHRLLGNNYTEEASSSS